MSTPIHTENHRQDNYKAVPHDEENNSPRSTGSPRPRMAKQSSERSVTAKQAIVPVPVLQSLVKQVSVREVQATSAEEVNRTLDGFLAMESGEAVLRYFGVDSTTGLTDSHVAKQVDKYGKNELDKPPPVSFFMRLAGQFTDFLVLILIAAAIISAAFQDFAEFVAITLIILVNASVGVYTEGQADDAVGALESSTENTCSVKRNGAFVTLNQSDIVPGDIISVKSGASICADAVVINISGTFKVEEAQLTGESIPLAKFPKKDIDAAGHHKSIIFKGTSVVEGSCEAVVILTGMKTMMGTTAALLNSVETMASPLQENLEELGQQLGYASIFMSIVVLIVGITTGRGADPTNDQPLWLQMILIAVSLTVAAVPEGLPVCVTITLAMGMQAMAKVNCLVKNLKSVETLGAASVICSDKTGTLTEGLMSVVRVFANFKDFEVSGTGYSTDGTFKPDPKQSKEDAFFRVLNIAYFCNEAKMTINTKTQKEELEGNMTDKALYVLARKQNLIDPTAMQIEEIKPFNSTLKMMATIVSNRTAPFDAGRLSIVKGAPNYILDNCNIDAESKARITKQINDYSDQAFRVIAFAYKHIANDASITKEEDLYTGLTFCGLTAIFDPPRKEVPQAVRDCRGANIQVKMITGDYLNTAIAVAKEIDLIVGEYKLFNKYAINKDEKYVAIDCSCLTSGEFPPEQVKRMILECNVFARAKPEDKITIVNTLKDEKYIVAMTGDGVNDSPALKAADIGVAMGITGTDVAKAAAQMILVDDSFASIVKAIREGRRIYANIVKFVYFLLTTNPAEVFVILISVLMGIPSALTAVQILWLNLTSDSFSALALSVEPLEDYVMHIKPRLKDASIINNFMIAGIAFHTVILTAVVLGSYVWALEYFSGHWTGNEDSHAITQAQTVTIYVIVFSELMRSFTCRSMKYSSFSLNFWAGKWVIGAFVGACGSTVAIGMIPGLIDVFEMAWIDGTSWGFIIGISFIPAICDEFFKMVCRYVELDP